jgi:hypothetical protein
MEGSEEGLGSFQRIMAAYDRHGRQRSACFVSDVADFAPVAFSSPRSAAGKASGQRRARIAM